MSWTIGGKLLTSRLLLGTAQYPSLAVLCEAVVRAQAEIITLSLRRETSTHTENSTFWQSIQALKCNLLPNTAGCKDIQSAVTTAELSRELFNTNWIKLEIIGDDYTLHPNSFELIKAAKILIDQGFEVFPYCTDDLIACQKLVDVGCKILMPLAAPIGSGKGLLNPYTLELLRKRFPHLTLIIDAGIGKPSDALRAMELGYDAVLLNTAVAAALNPPLMAEAFAEAVSAGHKAFTAGIIPERNYAVPSTPLLDTPFWHHNSIHE